MFGFERAGQSPKKVSIEPPPEIDDYLDSPVLHNLLARLPAEIRTEHLTRIAELTDEQAEGYLYALHEKRSDALRECEVSDESIKTYFNEHSAEIWDALETRIFTDPENHIRAGTTARIKKFNLSEMGGVGEEQMPTVAVKYLVTPTEKTLSVSGEHDLILELEQIRKIEIAELAANGPDTHVRVPHPYFYYTKGKIQCYAMELIDGINLEQGMSNSYDVEIRDELRASLKDVGRETIYKELDAFFDTMHLICVHGDVKPRNIMISRDGHFYMIDFGQSLLANNVNEASGEAFENIKDMEKQQAKDAVRYFLDALFKERD